MAMDMHQQLADMQAAMRALWPDRPKVYFVPGEGDDAPVLTDEERGQLHRVTLAISDGRKPVDTAPEAEVLEADDTVPVEKLAHWLHGQFDTDHVRWAEETEIGREYYRRIARGMTAALPELFR